MATDFVRTEYRTSTPEELLGKPTTALLGVSTAAGDALQIISVKTVFDLATSDVFAAATKILDAGTNAKNVLYQHGSATSDLVHDTAATGKRVNELQYLPLNLLARIPDDKAATLQSALDVTTVRELALYPPYKAALFLLNTVYFPENLAQPLPEQPRDLLPTNGEHPTERVQYTTLIMDEISTGDGAARIDLLSPTFTPLDLSKLAAGDDGFKRVAFGALLTFTQSWYTQGVTLGQLLHSTSLAPGESTRIAVIDWSRKTSASQTQVTTQTESLNNDMTQDRAINEVTSATAREAQSGFSSSDVNSKSTQQGTSAAGEISAPLGGLLGGPSGSMGSTSSEATSNTQADGYSTSTGQRDVGSQMIQNVHDRTHQNAHSIRGSRASVVKEVSESEKETVSTRVVANYNHMHALNIQYYEVVQLYKIKVGISKAERVVFIPVRMADFTDDSLIRRFKNVLVRASPTYEIRDALDNLDVMELVPNQQINFTRFGGFTIDDTLRDRVLRTTIVSSIPNLLARSTMLTRSLPQGISVPPTSAPTEPTVPPPVPTAAPQPAATSGGVPLGPSSSATSSLAEFRITNAALLQQHIANIIWDPSQASRLSGMFNRPVFRASSPSLYLPTDVTIVDSSVASEEPTIKETFHLLNGTTSQDPSATNSIAITEVASITLKGGNNDKAVSAVVHLSLSRNGVIFPMELPQIDVPKANRLDINVVSVKGGGIGANAKKFLQDNRALYNLAILRSLSSAQIALLLSGYSMMLGGLSVPVSQVVEPKPIRYVGNYLAFLLSTDKADTAWANFLNDHGITVGSSTEDIVPLPSGGVFAEAVLGRSNCAEKLDITRFWNWQDSAIPLQPTDIAAVQTGSRGTNEVLTPGQLANPIINMQQPSSMPDPVGTAAILTAIQNGNMFRDMSGLQATIGLAQAATQATQAGASTAGQQAGENMNNLLKANTERQKIAADMISDLAKTAASIYTMGAAGAIGGRSKGSGGNHSQDGAKINYFDKTATPGQSSATTSGAGPVLTPSTSSGSSHTSSSSGSSGSQGTGGSSAIEAQAESVDPVFSKNPAALAATWSGDGAPPSALFQTVADKVAAPEMTELVPMSYFTKPTLKLTGKSTMGGQWDLGINAGGILNNAVELSSTNMLLALPPKDQRLYNQHSQYRWHQTYRQRSYQRINGKWVRAFREENPQPDNPDPGVQLYDDASGKIYMYDSPGWPFGEGPTTKNFQLGGGIKSDDNATEFIVKLQLETYIEGLPRTTPPQPWEPLSSALTWVSTQWIKRDSLTSNWHKTDGTKVVWESDTAAASEYYIAPEGAEW